MVDHGVTQNWNHFDPSAYLSEYYGDVGSENVALLRFLLDSYRKIPKGGVLLDFGGGPTIYPLISAVTRVDEIHFSDYLEVNLEEVSRWISGESTAFDWDEFIRHAIELETVKPCMDADVARRASEIRERVTRLTRCDASCAPPIENSHQFYDVLVTNFCAESATSNRRLWRVYMANILSMLKPGGWLVISALTGATRYSVGERSFPAVDVSESQLIDLLEENGFSRTGIEMRCVSADRPMRDYKGLMFALARKDSVGNGEGS